MPSSLTLVGVAAKRVREQKFKQFGDVLKEWRGQMDIETAVRGVRNLGVDFDGATLRGWEYGWTGAPDPMRLLALAHVYGRTSTDVLQALAIARNIALPLDLSRHSGTRDSTLPTGGVDRGDSTRERVLEGKLIVAEAMLDEAREHASRLLAALRPADGEGAPTPSRSSGRTRKSR